MRAYSCEAFQNSNPFLLNRIYDEAGNLALPAIVASVARTIVDDAAQLIVSATGLDPSALLFSELQTGPMWTADGTGYNFLDQLPAGSLPLGRRLYKVEYNFALTSGNHFYSSWDVYTKPTFS